MSDFSLCHRFIEFLAASPTAFHAAKNLAARLSEQGFIALDENRAWSLEAGGKYYFLRADSTIVGFIVGKDTAPERGMRLVGAHTDSPCLKVTPQPEKNTKGYQQLGIEVYGGALLNPWFDRDLSLAGKVCYLDNSGALQSALVNFEAPIAVIPNLAIHMDRTANENRTVNPQKDMSPILFQGEGEFNFRELLREQLAKEGVSDVSEVLDFDMSFYDVQTPALVGLKQDFLVGARLDNLLSSFIGTEALANAGNEFTSIMICNDHEEVGSQSDIGAGGTALTDLLTRLWDNDEARQMALRASLMLSVDNAHGVHPNYLSFHDDNHGPILNKGPVIKFDAKQSYATSSHSAAFLRQLARQGDVLPLQSYVTRADMRCGSTIGPITASNTGVKALDIGVPTFAMHSTRELAGTADVQTLYQLIERFYACDSVSL